MKHVAITLKLTAITLVLFGVIYPLFITGIAKIIAPNGGKGKQVIVDGKVVGFELIGQKFDNDKYFNSRPSAVDYNAASTGGSNKGPSNPDYLNSVRARIDTFRVHNPTVSLKEIPADLVTASGGGLDPHISPAAARVQIDRIARVRGIDKNRLTALVNDYVEEPWFGLLGPTRVHVLKLNIALDEMEKIAKK